MSWKRKFFAGPALLLMTIQVGCNLALAETAPPRSAEPGLPIIATTIQLDGATVTATNTPQASASRPILKVTRDTACQAGPHVAYAFTLNFTVGMSAPVVGRYFPSNYWIIEYPDGAGATCWLWGEFAIVEGDFRLVPQVITPPQKPPTATPSPLAPNPAGRLLASCAGAYQSSGSGLPEILVWTVTLKWEDMAENEIGFRIYKDGSLFATIEPNLETFVDSFPVNRDLQHGPFLYGVQSFNSQAEAVIVEFLLQNCAG